MPNLDPIQMSALYDTGNTLHSTLDLDEVMKHAAALGARLMRARRCVCVVFEENGDKREASSDIPLDELNRLHTTLEPHLQTVRDSARPTRLTGLAADSVWQPLEVRELLLAPVKADDFVLGAVYVDRATDASPFTEAM